MARLRYATASDFGEIVTAATLDMTDVITCRGLDRLTLSPFVREVPIDEAERGPASGEAQA